MSIPFTPRPYQYIARDFILDTQRCNLWAQPGLGKTSTIYSVLDILQMCGSSFFPALVIAPKRVCELTWPAERDKWTDFNGMRIASILGEEDARDDALMAKADVYFINYDNVQWLMSRIGKRWPFKIVVADESTRLKSFRVVKGGKRAAALGEIARSVGRWINLTGTPAPNGAKDLWGQNWFVDFGARLGTSYEKFMRRWYYVNPYSRTCELRHESCFDEIKALLADCTLALRAEDWFPIQKPLYVTREVVLPPEARSVYDQMEKNFYAEIDSGAVTAANAAVKSLKLLQIASGALYDANKTAHWLHDAKIEALRSLVDEMSGEPLLVAYWFKYEPDLIRKVFPEFRVFKDKKDEKDWNEGRVNLMGIHPASAGHGVNLQHGGSKMAHFTLNWDLELRQQVEERIGVVRQMQSGYNRLVTHYNIIARDTMDQVVLDRLASKAGVQESLMLARARRP